MPMADQLFPSGIKIRREHARKHSEERTVITRGPDSDTVQNALRATGSPTAR